MKKGINDEVLVVSSSIGRIELNRVCCQGFVLVEPNSVISIKGIEKNWGASKKKVKSNDIRPAFGMVRYNRRG